ncbi:hypothetical protein [Bacillus thuringiensis]|uniref:hypothetical protein n=1 Tax=Bacillus thuringiensis TaxID=1428 RepID=UPI0011242839|nr:hypothetical protein [Bacillus thuringiensis]
MLTERRAKALLNNGIIQSVPSAGFGFYMPVIMNRLEIWKQHSELCFPPLLTIQIYHVDSKTAGTFPAKKRSPLCQI